MQLPQSTEIEISHLNHLFDKTSECYKFFWFQAMLTKISQGYDMFSYEELLDEMIADAWYMVTEYHLNLGPRDNLEKLVKYVQGVSGLKSSEKKSVIIQFIHNSHDKEIIRRKRELKKNVPYRLQAPFMPEFRGGLWETTEKELVQRINKQNHLMYYFHAFDDLNTKIQMQTLWMEYLKKNQEIVKGWLQYKMICYLQKRNPSVPGIADKLHPPVERNLEKVKKYWKMLLEIQPIHEIYADIELTDRDMSIDHFIPWSYVAHDELWNLHPTTKVINSKKSNFLPDWKLYFPNLCKQEFFSYQMIWEYEKVHTMFLNCAKEHLNNDHIRSKLYRQGLGYDEFQGILNNVVSPVYQAARDCGFANWILKDETSG